MIAGACAARVATAITYFRMGSLVTTSRAKSMDQSQRNNLTLYIFLLSLLIAAFVRLWAIDFGLPFRYHIDEPAYVLAALQMGQGNFHITYPHLSPNLQEFLYLGLYGLLFVLSLIRGTVSSPLEFAHLYQINPTPFYILARSVSVIASLGTIIVLFLMAQQIFPNNKNKTPLVASVFLGLCFLDVRHAHFAEPYSLIALFVLTTTYLTLLYVQSKKNAYLVMAGLACGVAIGLRLSIFPLVITPLLGFIAIQRKDRRISSFLITASILAVALMVGFMIGCPGLILNSHNFVEGLFGQSSLAVTDNGFWGFQFSELSSPQFYWMIAILSFGLPVILFAIIGFMRAVSRHKFEDILLCTFPILYVVELLLFSPVSSAFARYLVPILPFVAFFAAEGTYGFVRRISNPWSIKYSSVILGFVLLLLVAIPASRIYLLDRLWSRTDTRTLAKNWIEANVPEGSSIATQWYGPPLATLTDPEPNSKRTYTVKTVDPFIDDPENYSVDFYQQAGVEYLILSSYIYDLWRISPEENITRDRFYSSLNQSANPIAVFKPFTGNNPPKFFFEQMWGPINDLTLFDRPGPTIKIYKFSQ